MPKSKPPRRKAKARPPSPSGSPLRYPPKTQARTRWQVKATFRWIWKSVGILLTLAAFLSLLHTALNGVEIHASSAQIDDPFLLRFSLRNPNYLLAMQEVRIKCIIVNVESIQPISVLKDVTLYINNVSSIDRDSTAQYSCPFEQLISARNQIKATVIIAVDFKTLWIPRNSESEPFNWDSTSRQWMEGTPIN
jgi:hypothetical protein